MSTYRPFPAGTAAAIRFSTSTNTANTICPERQGEDFLFVCVLGSGVEGQAVLVRKAAKHPLCSHSLDRSKEGSGKMGEEEEVEGEKGLFVWKRTVRDPPSSFSLSASSSDTGTEECTEEAGIIKELVFPAEAHENVPAVLCAERFEDGKGCCCDDDGKGMNRCKCVGSNGRRLATQGYFTLQEYCNGGTLSALIDAHAREKKVVPEVFIWNVLLALSDVLDWCHNDLAVPITHNDISGRNVFLHYEDSNVDGKGEVVMPKVLLGDWGLSTLYLASDPVPAWTDGLYLLSLVGMMVSAHIGRPRGKLCTAETLEWDAVDETIWRPYSEELRMLMGRLNYESLDVEDEGWRNARDIVVEAHREYLCAAQYWANDEDKDGDVSWTRPAMRTEPLFLNEEELADAMNGFGEYSGLLIGTGDENVDYNENGTPSGMLAEPYDIVLVDTATLEVLREIEEDEVQFWCERYREPFLMVEEMEELRKEFELESTRGKTEIEQRADVPKHRDIKFGFPDPEMTAIME
ncbi:MAG: hypothetical protein Q9227_003616 [Pyrenula ochraceoflavens]